MQPPNHNQSYRITREDGPNNYAFEFFGTRKGDETQDIDDLAVVITNIGLTF
jgi:hypothetical protein